MKNAIPGNGQSGAHVDPLMESSANAPVMHDADYRAMRDFYHDVTVQHCGAEVADIDLKLD